MAVGDAERQAARVAAGVRLAQATGTEITQLFPRAEAADLGPGGLKPALGDTPIHLLGISRKTMFEKYLYDARLASFFFRSDSPSHLATSLASLSEAADRARQGRSSMYDVFAQFAGYRANVYDNIPAGKREEVLAQIDAAGRSAWALIPAAIRAGQTTFEARVFDPDTGNTVTRAVAITQPMAFDAGYTRGFSGGVTNVNYTVTMESGATTQYRLNIDSLRQLATSNPEEFRQLVASLRKSMEEVFTPGDRLPTLARSYNMGAVAGMLKAIGHEVKLAQAVVPNIGDVRHAQVGQEALGILDGELPQLKAAATVAGVKVGGAG